MTVIEPTTPSSEYDELRRAREAGRQEADRRLKGHRGRTSTLSREELASLLQDKAPSTVGRVGAAIDDAS